MSFRRRDISPKLKTRKKFVTAPRHIYQVGRNDPCPCGSAKKYKDCHADKGEAYLKKLAREQEKERLQKLRSDLKQKGVPWWKRLFVRI